MRNVQSPADRSAEALVVTADICPSHRQQCDRSDCDGIALDPTPLPTRTIGRARRPSACRPGSYSYSGSERMCKMALAGLTPEGDMSDGGLGRRVAVVPMMDGRIMQCIRQLREVVCEKSHTKVRFSSFSFSRRSRRQTILLSTILTAPMLMFTGYPRTALPAAASSCLGFLEAFRTFWVAPQPGLRVLMGEFL